MRNNEDRKGGLLSGKPHSEGGIKGVIKDDQRPVELEGGEAIVNKTTMKSDKTFEFEGDEKTPCEIISDLNQLDGKGVPISCDTVEPASRDAYKKGGSVGTQTETYKKWRSLVNMTYSQIKNFYNSQEGKEAGLSSAEAREQGIDSGRESARWLMKMKQTKQSDWTPMMWRWAKKQISFISRMSGNKGGLYDDKGNKTRKHTSLLIWGHNPDKKQSDKFEEGGDVRVLLAPNGKPSNLSPEQYELVRTPAFKKWFGDWENDPENASKVVDANGEPLVVYHGSDKMDTINIFKSSKGHEFNFFSADSLESARYVKDFEAEYPNDRYNQNLRKEYYDKKIKEFFLKSNKIYNYEKISSVEREKSINLMLQNKQYFLDLIKENIKNMGLEYRFYLEDELGLAPNITLEELFSYWLESSSDDWWVLESSIFQNFIKSNNYDSFVTKESGNFNIAVFEPTQIKLADGTNTTFDGSNPDIRFEQGGNISKTPAPLKEQITGSDINKKGSASDSNSAKYIDFSEKTMQAIENKVAEHNKAHNNKKVTISVAKAVVRRGMGAYSTSHRPTISGGKPNSRVAWGLARLNAFLYKIVNGKSESGKYSQDDDLIAELGYSVKKYETGGLIDKDLINLTAFNKRAKSKLKEWDYEHLTTIGEKQRAIQAMYAWEYYAKKNIIILAEPDMEFEGSYYQWVAINDHNYQINFGFRFGYYGKDKLSITNVEIALLDEDFKEIKDPNILFEQGGSVSLEATLLAPNGKPSNLSPKQHALVRTAAFKAWFGDWENDPANASKVVDENGEPLVVYHGSDKDFNEFTQGEFGFHFGGLSAANEREATFVKPFFIHSTNPLRFDYDLGDWEDLEMWKEYAYVYEDIEDSPMYEILSTSTSIDELKNKLRQHYDGIKYFNAFEGDQNEASWIFFDSTQIKLADGSNTTFDGSSPDIRFEQGGAVNNDGFKKWFGNSKVVDKKGNPLIVYHGSPDLRGLKEKYVFISRFLDNQSFFFTDNYLMAKSYADPKRAFDYQNSEEGVIGLYLSLQNPLVVQGFNQVWRQFETTIDGNEIIGTRNLINFAKNKGYDGVIVENVRDYYDGNEQKTKGGNVYVAFEPEQIKLADGTNTTFDSSSPDIRYEQGGSIDTPYEINAQGGYTYTGEAKSTAKEVDLISIPRSINGTNCGNCYFSEKGVCAHKNIKLPITDKMCCSLWDNTNSMRSWDKPIFKKVDVSDVDKNEFEKNELGGYEYTGEAKEIAKKYDLLTLPASVRGTNCANCSFYTSLAKGGFCFRHNILLPVTPRMSCTYWNNLSADRSWDFFEQGGSVKATLLAPNGKPSNLTPEQHALVRTAAFKAWFGDWENDPANSSKVVDANGEPLVVYHGSVSHGITEFDRTASKRESSGLREFAHYFSSNKALAEMYSKARAKEEVIEYADKQLHKLQELQNETRNNRDFDRLQDEINILTQYKLGIGKVYAVFLSIKRPLSFEGDGLDEMAWRNLSLSLGYKIASGRTSVMEALSGNNSAYKNIDYDGVIGRNFADMSSQHFFTENKEIIAETKKNVKHLVGDNFAVWNSNQIKLADGSNTTFDGSNPDIRFAKGGAIKKITPSPKFYEKGGEITPKQAAEELLKKISPQDLESLKQAYVEARNEALLQSQKRIEYLESSAVKLKELIGTFYPDERQRAIRDVTQKALRHERNVELAYTNGGSVATLDDKIGNTYKSVPDFSNIDTTIITFDEETILEDPKPPYVPFIDEPLFARKGYVVDAIRVMPDLYVYATNGFNGDAKSLLIRANSPVAFATLEDIGGYILVTLDQLVLITDYYITIAKAKSRLEAAAQTERNEKYYDSQSEGYRERILNQRGFYRTLPLSIQKKITQEDWEALDLQGKEAIYKPYKRQGSKRAVSKFKPNSMYTSFHLMYEVFLNPEAKLRGRTGHPEVFAYWRKFAEMMSYKLVDISEARKFESESYQAGLETSFGDSNTDPELYNTYGLLVKRQNGDKIAPFEIDQIKDAWIKLNGTFGKLTRQAKEFGLKISHAGLKHMYARKSIGVYWSRFKTIGVSNIYGAKPFTYIFAHEVGHWIDNLLGSQTGKRYLCDDYESEAGQIAVAFRKNMNKKSTSDYYNSTKECFARAMEQHFALSTDGDNASMVTPIEDKVKEMLYVLNDNYVSADSYHNTIKPLILAFFVKYKDFFVYDTDIVEDMPAVIEPNAQIETTKEAVAEAKKEVSDLPKQQATLNHGYGLVINNLYSEWSRIKNQKEQSNWEETVRNIKFGTYGQKSIFDVLENFPLTGLSEVTRLSFLSDLEGALKIPFDERKYNTKVDIDLGLIQRQKELALAMELELALIELELELE